MNKYKEGFSAVGFDCSNKNFLTGVVNLTDAVKMIEKITRQGAQVSINLNFLNFEFFEERRLMMWELKN